MIESYKPSNNYDSLKPVAIATGIKVPDNCSDYKFADFPHWTCLLMMRGRLKGSLDDNARVIASIPDSEIVHITVGKLKEYGINTGTKE